MQSRDTIFYHAFSRIGGFGPQKFKMLLSYFGSLKQAWNANRNDLLASGISPPLIDSFLRKKPKIFPEEDFSKLKKEEIELVIQNHSAYPPQLKEIPSAPAVLYARGNLEALKNKSLAIVGSRKFTEYGKRVTESLCRDLVSAGLTVISGLALGIDAIAHRATLAAGGLTIAVLGSGIDNETIYPRDNFNLAREILANNGTLITEYPPKTPSFKQNFPARNRIMAGLTLGTLVIEAAEDSGSLITANLALEFGREVFAIPGPIFSPQSAGTNYLLKNGAKLVESTADILEELRVSSHQGQFTKKIFEPKTNEEKIIWKLLGSDPLHVDKISKLTKLNPAEVSSVLATLEIQGAAKNIGGQNYIRT